MAENEEHIHDCTGPDQTCPCGFVFRVPPVMVSVTVYDHDQLLVDDGFNCETLDGAIAGLDRAIRKLRGVRRALPR